MEAGRYYVRTWLSPNERIKEFPDTLTIYDAGDKQGWLIKNSAGKTVWTIFQVEFRNMQEQAGIQESGFLLHESEAPFKYFSITQYPLRQVQLSSRQTLFSLPQAEILLTVSEILPSPSSQQPPQLLREEPVTLAGPESHASPKSYSKRRVDGQPSLQNRNKVLPTSKALSSSNRGRHGQPLLPTPRKQAEHQQLSAPENHNDRESSESHPWTSLAQQSQYSRPPPELEAVLSAQASTSQFPKDSVSY